MKKNILVGLLLISSLSYSQRFKEALMWQIETQAGGIVFGISENKEDAEYIMQDFQVRNANSKYDISDFRPYYKYTTYSVEKSHVKPVDEFKQIAKKPYKVLSAEDIQSFNIAKKEGLEKGIDYYSKSRNVKRSFAASRIKNIVHEFDKYIIKSNNYLAFR